MNISLHHHHHQNASHEEEGFEESEPNRIEIDTGNVGFMLMSSSLLWIMVPGCGFFYSGMARSKSALSMITMSMWSTVIVSIQWFLYGYSLTFSTSSSNPIVGNFQKALLIGVYDKEFSVAQGIPELAFCIYQAVTATLPCAIMMGAVAERGRILPALIFIPIWNTLVYNPCSYWSLNPNGWSLKLGMLDFGGAAPVHVPAGAAALVYSYMLGPRDNVDRFARPHNMVNIALGTVLIWFGCFGYNAGSAFGANMQALVAFFVTNLAGSVSAFTWSLLDFLHEGKFTAFGLCAGAVVGVIGICPASGIISPISAIPISVMVSIICRWGHFVKTEWKFDDTLDVFAMHGLAGIVGILLTGVFAQKSYGAEDAGDGGWIDGHWMQVPIQMADTFAGFLWSFAISFVVLYLMNKTLALRLRMDPDPLKMGQDEMEMGVRCYEHVQEIKLDAIQCISPSVEGSLKFAKTNHIGLRHHPTQVMFLTDAHEPLPSQNDFRNYWF